MSELASNGVQIYQFPVDDETVAETNSMMNGHFPFAVCGSTDFIRVGNKMVRARQYPWGTVQGNHLSRFYPKNASSFIFIFFS
jgi:septin family protein